MIRLDTPADANGTPYVAAEVYDLCIAKVRNPDRRARLAAIRAYVAIAADDFHAKATQANLHLVARTAEVANVSKSELVGVYERMTQENNDGRPVYDRIMIGATGERCPLCGKGQVKTLDHHLPQSHYTLLCVNPRNLVPACRDCQSEKKADYPKTRGTQTLHPYYDHYQNDIWLRAEVILGQSATFRYFVDQGAPFHHNDIERLTEHVKVFGLAGRFSVRAAEELQDIRQGLRKVFDAAQAIGAAGATEVRSELEARTVSSEANLKNSWRSAMYRASMVSDWFCDGGFAQT